MKQFCHFSWFSPRVSCFQEVSRIFWFQNFGTQIRKVDFKCQVSKSVGFGSGLDFSKVWLKNVWVLNSSRNVSQSMEFPQHFGRSAGVWHGGCRGLLWGRTSLNRAALPWAGSAAQPAVGQGKDVGAAGLALANASSEIPSCASLLQPSPPGALLMGASLFARGPLSFLTWGGPWVSYSKEESCRETRLSKEGGLIWEKVH